MSHSQDLDIYHHLSQPPQPVEHRFDSDHKSLDCNSTATLSNARSPVFTTTSENLITATVYTHYSAKVSALEVNVGTHTGMLSSYVVL